MSVIWFVLRDYVPGPLLEEHGACSDDDALKHGLALEQATNSDELKLGYAAGTHVLQMREVFLEGLLFEKRLRPDLGVFEFNQFVVLRQASETSEHTAGFRLAIVVDEPTRGEGHKEHAYTKEYSWNKLKAEG